MLLGDMLKYRSYWLINLCIFRALVVKIEQVGFRRGLMEAKLADSCWIKERNRLFI